MAAVECKIRKNLSVFRHFAENPKRLWLFFLKISFSTHFTVEFVQVKDYNGFRL